MVEGLGVDEAGGLAFTLVLDPGGSPRLTEILPEVAGNDLAAAAEIERVGLFVREGEKLLSPLVAARRRPPLRR